MVAAELMGSVYWRLLRKLERPAVQRLRPRTHPAEQGPKAAAHSAHLVPVCVSASMSPELWRLSRDASRSSAPRRLIVNADDFGRSAAINQAVIRAHREGILTTASLMVNEPGLCGSRGAGPRESATWAWACT